MNLINKRVPIEDYCDMCGQAVEDSSHLFMKCNKAVEVWGSTSIGDCSNVFCNIKDFWNACTKRPQCVRELAGVILWQLWRARNELVFSNRSISCGEVVVASISQLDHWKVINAKHNLQSPVVLPAQSNNRINQNSPTSSSCSVPPNGFISCSFDDAVKNGQDRWCYGAVIRDDRGNFIACSRDSVVGKVSPVMVELYSFKEALSWVNELRLKKVVFESDSQTVVKACIKDNMNWSNFGVVLTDCKQALKNIESSSIKWINRSVNGVVNALAKSTYSITDGEEFYDVIPPFISSLM